MNPAKLVTIPRRMKRTNSKDNDSRKDETGGVKDDTSE